MYMYIYMVLFECPRLHTLHPHARCLETPPLLSLSAPLPGPWLGGPSRSWRPVRRAWPSVWGCDDCWSVRTRWGGSVRFGEVRVQGLSVGSRATV